LRFEPSLSFGYKHPSNLGKIMRSLPLAALAVFSLAVPAWAVDLGAEVQVNPVSASGREMLLYPGGQYMRLVPALRQPGDKGAPIRLHMPVKRARSTVARAEAPVAPRAETPRPAPKLASAAPARPAANPAPRSATPPGSAYASGPGAASLFNSLPTISAPPTPQTTLTAPSGAPPSGAEGLAMQGQILFAHDADTPSDDSLDSIRVLAGRLNGSLGKAQARIELMAFGGTKGDKGSDARRLSLKRALAIRQLLIDSGVSSARIDVHAQGGVDDSGPTDRVDVYIRG
jgi:outer membrane protein OmpA-like peptidoglycan-associated protein